MKSVFPNTAFATVTAATPAKVGATGVRVLKKALLYAAADTVCEFKNGATDTGTVLLTIAALAGECFEIDLTDVGGVSFSTAMFCKPVGVGSICYVWYE